MTTATRTRKAPKAARTLRILDTTGGAVRLLVTDGGTTAEYTLRRQESDFGQAFACTKDGSTQYDVLLANDDDGRPVGSCDCKAGIYHGNRGPCKHVSMTLKLVGMGKV